MKFAALLMTLIMHNNFGFAQEQKMKNDGLSLKLRSSTQRSNYQVKDSIVLEVMIANSSSTPIGVFSKLGLGYQGGVIIHVVDSKGAEVPPQTLAHDFLDASAVGDQHNYFELQPRQFFGTTYPFTVSEFVIKPGHYKMLAEYHCPVDSKYAKVNNFWGIEHKSITSKMIDFDVIEDKN